MSTRAPPSSKDSGYIVSTQSVPEKQVKSAAIEGGGVPSLAVSTAGVDKTPEKRGEGNVFDKRDGNARASAPSLEHLFTYPVNEQLVSRANPVIIDERVPYNLGMLLTFNNATQGVLSTAAGTYVTSGPATSHRSHVELLMLQSALNNLSRLGCGMDLSLPVGSASLKGQIVVLENLREPVKFTLNQKGLTSLDSSFYCYSTVARSITADANVLFSFKGVEAEGIVKYTSTVENRDGIWIGKIDRVFPLHTSEMPTNLDAWRNAYSSGFKDAIAKLEEGILDYEDVIALFGTHMVMGNVFGYRAKVEMTRTVKASDTSSKFDIGLKIAAQHLLSINFGFNFQAQGHDAAEASLAKETFFGPKEAVLQRMKSPTEPSDWKDMLPQGLAIVDYLSSPPTSISALMPRRLQEGMEQAITNELLYSTYQTDIKGYLIEIALPGSRSMFSYRITIEDKANVSKEIILSKRSGSISTLLYGLQGRPRTVKVSNLSWFHRRISGDLRVTVHSISRKPRTYTYSNFVTDSGLASNETDSVVSNYSYILRKCEELQSPVKNS